MRRVILAEGEYYHIYNRGVDQRRIVQDEHDADRFIKCLMAFNTIEPVGSLYALSFDPPKTKQGRLVDIIAYCLNPNHFHLALLQKHEKGISRLMQRLSGGYGWYFNNKYKRTGSLVEGRFKAKHIENNDYLLHLSTYINLNDKVHKISARDAKLVRNSWKEYTENTLGYCTKEIILSQFISRIEYKKFALDNLPGMLEMRPIYAELKTTSSE